jgi:hypothetical protein
MISILNSIGVTKVKPEDIPGIIVAVAVMKYANKYLTADKVEAFRSAVTAVGANVDGITTLYSELTNKDSTVWDNLIPGLAIAKSKEDPDFDVCAAAFEEWMNRAYDIMMKYKTEVETATEIANQQISKIDEFMEKKTALSPQP